MFYLGFDDSANLSGHILKFDFVCEETQATGVKRSDPPWVWECSIGNGQWAEITPSNFHGEKDTTGGLNNPRGQIGVVFAAELPRSIRFTGARRTGCAAGVEQRREEQGMYTQSPRVVGVTAYALGATTRATHAVVVKDEVLG